MLVNNIFNNIKIHTQYSICEGAIKIDELAEYCKAKKIRCLGLADNYNLCGALEFSEKLSKAGTQPIIGTQINLKEDNTIGKITLYAKTEDGYKNLTKLSSLSYLKSNEDEEPACSLTDLLKNSKDLILLTGSYRDFFGKLLHFNKIKNFNETIDLLKKHFTNRIYIEIQRHNENNEKNFENHLLNVSKSTQIPLIATQEVFYLNKDMYEAHDALTCIGKKNFVDDENRFKFSNQHFLKNHEELEKLYSDIPEALENNYNFHLRFNFKPNKSKPILPSITNDNLNSPKEELTKQAQEGLENRMKNFILKKNSSKTHKEIAEIYKDRLDHEINIINSMDYSSYFLIVSDYIKWAKKNSIPVGPGRGSGAGSLVAYCLDITDLDPIEYDLIFERFLNPDRISMPDFDIDFCEEKRDQVFEYLKKRYKDGVAHIITFGKLKARMVLRDVGRVIGLPYGHVDRICKMVPFDPSRPLTLQESIDREPRFKEEVKNNAKVKKLLELSLKLEGLNRNMATHAAAYAMIAYQTAYLKTYHKEDFIAATMSTELTNTSKLREFVEELKRLKVEIVRPDINKCFAEFKAINGKIYYGLGAIKNVGYEAISNIINEREQNGKFKSFDNFISRVDSKDINKLQLEGLTKAGVFDCFEKDRNKIFISIPKIIQQNKNINQDKENNQSSLFGSSESEDNQFEFLPSKPWKEKELLTEEFKSLGFYISNHPLNEYEEIFNQLKITSFHQFNKDETSEGLVAGTIMSLQEKKSAKGAPYAIVKFSDKKGEFELFLFSEVLINNRDK